MTIESIELPVISAGDVDLVAIDFTKWLDSGETLTGTPTVAEQTTEDLTFANIAVNVAAMTIKGKTVAIGKAVQFKVSGQQADTTYKVLVTVGTTSTPARTKKFVVRFMTAE